MRRISNPISIFIVVLTLCCGAGAGAKAFVSKDYDRVKHKNIIVAKSNDKYFAEHITSEFLTIGISVIDRQNTDAMMQELQLGQEGVIAPNAAKQIGQITGADAMLILEWYGGLSPLAKLKMIDAANGAVLMTVHFKQTSGDALPKEKIAQQFAAQIKNQMEVR